MSTRIEVDHAVAKDSVQAWRLSDVILLDQYPVVEDVRHGVVEGVGDVGLAYREQYMGITFHERQRRSLTRKLRMSHPTADSNC